MQRDQDHDLTARAAIRNAALRLFAERGPDAVTVRQVAAAADVSPALVLHHFGSKRGLRDEVDAFAAGAFDAVLERVEGDLTDLSGPETMQSIAEAFAEAFPPESPLPSYLRRLLLTGDPAGFALIRRWYVETVQVLDSMVAAGAASRSDDPPVRAAFLLVNDLALVLLRPQLSELLGEDPLSRTGIDRWAAEAFAVYTRGAFMFSTEEERS